VQHVQAGRWPALDDVSLGQAHHWPHLQRGRTTALLLDWRASPDGTGRIDRMTRDQQRLAARRVLRQVLAAHLKVALDAIVMARQPGLAPQWHVRSTENVTGAAMGPVGVSLSHEEGISLIALRPEAELGVDLFDLFNPSRVQAWPDTLDVATLYLGPEATRRCADAAGLGDTQLARQFGVEWTRHEAAIKCLGHALREWHPALAAQAESCVIQSLALPEPWLGAAAWRNPSNPP